VVAGGKKVWAGAVISVLASLVFLLSASLKLRGGPDLDKGFEHLGLPLSMRVPLSILELSCVAIYLIPPTSVLGSVLLTGYLGGAICTHWRVGDPFYIHMALGLLIWLGVYLREDRLKDVLPLRRQWL
jgi:hypothetical protein